MLVDKLNLQNDNFNQNLTICVYITSAPMSTLTYCSGKEQSHGDVQLHPFIPSASGVFTHSVRQVAI